MSTTTPTEPGQAAPPPIANDAPVRRPLQRSRRHRVIGGVAGGLSEYLGIDVVIVRIAFVVLCWLGGSGILAYLAAWVLLPKAPADPPAERIRAVGPFGKVDGRQLLAIALVGIGAMSLFDRLGFGIDGNVLVPFVLVGIGVAVLMSSRPGAPGDHDGGTTTAHGEGSGNTIAGPRRSSFLATKTDVTPTGRGPDQVGDSAETDNLIDEFDLLRAPRAHEFEAGHLLSPKLQPAPSPAPVTVATTTRRGRAVRSPFARSAFGLLLVSIGLLFVASQFGAMGGRIDRVLACALFVVGLFLTIGAFLGRPRGFLTIGVLLTAVLAVFSVSGTSWQGGFGQRFDAPLSIQDVRASYKLAGGAMRLDFSNINFSGQRRVIDVDVSAGALAIEVPANVRVVVVGTTGFGEMTLFGQHWSGTDTRRQVTDEGTAGTIELHAHVGFGALEVARIGKLQKLRDLPGETTTSILKDGAR